MVSMQIAALVVALSGVGETVLLDFQAPWCAPCRTMEGTIDELQKAGYPVRKVDVDRERALASQHNVQSIPCFVLLVDGKEAGRLTGAVGRSELVDLFAKARLKPGEASGEVARGQSPDPPARGFSLPGRKARNPLTSSRRGVAPSWDGASTASTAPAAANETSPSGPLNPNDLIDVSVRLTVADPQGVSHGSGTLIDSRHGEALILTCGHLFRDSQGKGEITVDLLGSQARQKLPARLVAYDLKADVALVSIKPGTPLAIAPVAPKGYRIAKGDRVLTVGCNNGGEPTAVESKITGIDKFLGPPNLQVAGMPVQGRSGGGLFTSEGQVIGVCNAADPADNEGLFAALATVQGELNKAGLAGVYENPAPHSPAALAKTPDVPAMPTRMPGPNFGPRGSSRDAAPARAPAASLASLSPAERAALAEVQKRGDGAEVICIVRSLTDPQAKSEVIMLDRASSAFLHQLAADREIQESRHLTSDRRVR